MKNVTRIIFLALCGALALSSCNKKVHTPDPQDQKTPIGFSAVSETSTVKSATEATPSLSKFHEDFGVWGIARHSSSTIQPYVLWGEDELSEVYAEENEEYVSDEDKYTGVFIPREDAYWLVGYTYNFLAIAPYTDLGAIVTPVPATETSKDALTFTYDLGEKYDASDYDFDLMAAAAETEVTSSRTYSQELTFWHLLTTIKINVTFTGLQGSATGELTGMRLTNVDSNADYIITFDEELAAGQTPDADYPLSITCDAATRGKSQKTISFNGLASGGNIIRIVPQNIEDFRLYIDFKITESGKPNISTSNFEVNLSSAKDDPSSEETKHRGDYGPNQWYNWNIVISPKVITFSVSVADWNTGENFEHPIQ